MARFLLLPVFTLQFYFGFMKWLGKSVLLLNRKPPKTDSNNELRLNILISFSWNSLETIHSPLNRHEHNKTNEPTTAAQSFESNLESQLEHNTVARNESQSKTKTPKIRMVFGAVDAADVYACAHTADRTLPTALAFLIAWYWWFKKSTKSKVSTRNVCETLGSRNSTLF